MAEILERRNCGRIFIPPQSAPIKHFCKMNAAAIILKFLPFLTMLPNPHQSREILGEQVGEDIIYSSPFLTMLLAEVFGIKGVSRLRRCASS
jgi:hypothetical protein